MAAAKPVRVRVLPARTLTTCGRHYVAGDELEFPADEAKTLVTDEIVEEAPRWRR